MYDSAEKVYQSAVEKTSGSDYFYQKLGNLALKNNDIDTTLSCYRKVLEANPKNREILVKIATILQTYFPENTEEAIDCYERLLEFDIDTAQIYYELGHLYMSEDDKLNSISAFKLAVDREPENPFYNNSLGYAYARAELYDDAIEHYQKAMSNKMIADMIKYKGYSKELIIADSAEPKSIDDIRRNGIHRLIPAKKGKDSILNGIQYIQDFKIYVHPKCENTLIELSNYVWDTKEGNVINKPIDDYNHLMDALRYSLEDIRLGGVKFDRNKYNV